LWAREDPVVKLFATIPSWLKRRVPALDWLAHYERKQLPGDALAGVIVATLLIPQGMAYALLAGLPKLSFPALGGSEFLALIPLALTVSFVGFLESISVAQTLASNCISPRSKDR